MSQDARTLASAPHPHPQSLFNRRGGSRDDTEPRRFPEVVSLPLSQVDDLIDFETRSSRSASTASRSTNRLSLTLPIAPPNAFPSRPPASSTSLSFPPTPLDTPNVLSPTDPNDFITAIAAQERRVLELREELDRAESDLAKLKRSWATHEAYKKRGERQRQLAEPLRPIVTNPDLLDDDTPRKNVDIDRRRALLLAGQQSTPERTRRRVFTGRHTRTLSLLSPTKPTEGFSVHEDDPNDQKPNSDGDSPYVSRYAPITPAQLAKRASWAPRSTIPPSGVQGGVKQIAQDLKVGLWTFMEDLRQATVGEEPITGQGTYLRGVDGNMRPTIDGHSPSSHSVNQDTIRASSATGSRPRVTAAFDETAATSQDKEEPAPALPARPTAQLSRSKTETSKAAKRFSYTPLTVDAYDDNDECWSNWDSPSVSSPRWSGTTVNGDIITIPEKHDENDTPLKTKGSKSRLANRSPSPGSNTNKLEELLPPVLNRLTPANFKRTASDFMKEWEKSLSPPAPTTDLV
ncbi:hypothetical protein B0T17DRAFT_485574 [Bombardia bombarda]|uniref:DUF4048 domain-containing protein n=1 Tax=Bombardia bombarda TaxID=252184 RepID=A0AA39XLK7_9PEZI|nr:hypothetical protein B0T17DRAFT_485574 [Bombardia bombarda]